MWKKHKITVALGSGGARGWAHIGVLRALEDAGIQVDAYVGTSIGALVGASAAANRLDELEQLALQLDWKRVLYYFLDVHFPRSGLVDSARIEELFREVLQPGLIESLPHPFSAVVASMHSGRQVVLDHGDILQAVRASTAVPGIFTPVVVGDDLYADGGLVNPLPVSVADDSGADFVIASEINLAAYRLRLRGGHRSLEETRHAVPEGDRDIRENVLSLMNRRLADWEPSRLGPLIQWVQKEDMPNIFDMIGNARRIIQACLTEHLMKRSPPDLLIQPDVETLNFMDFHKAEEAIAAGYESASAAIDRLSPLTLRRLRD